MAALEGPSLPPRPPPQESLPPVKEVPTLEAPRFVDGFGVYTYIYIYIYIYIYVFIYLFVYLLFASPEPAMRCEFCPWFRGWGWVWVGFGCDHAQRRSLEQAKRLET